MRKIVVVASLLLWANLYAHSVIVDGDPTDWIGNIINATDTGYIDGGEAIWLDAQGDDIGDGGDAPYAQDNPEGYTYPTDTSFTGGEADIIQFRLTADTRNLYFLVKLDSFRSVYYPMVVITIDIDHTPGSGQIWLPQSADVLVDSLIQWEYAIILADNSIKVLDSAWTDITDSVAAQAVFNPNGGYIEAGLNARLLSPNVDIFDTTVYLTCAAGLNEFGHFKEVDSISTQWHGGGGLGTNGTDTSIYWVEPDVYDLAFVSDTDQINDLNTYNDSTMTPAVIRPTSVMEVNMRYVSSVKEVYGRKHKTLPVLFAHNGILKFDGNVQKVIVYSKTGSKIMESHGDNIMLLVVPDGAYFALVKSKEGQRLYKIISTK